MAQMNGNIIPVLAACGAGAAAFMWLRSRQNSLPDMVNKPMQQMGKQLSRSQET